MAIPSSGPLSFSMIATELGATGALSLRTMSATAGFVTPDAVSEFYGYSPGQYAVLNYIFNGIDVPTSSSAFVEVYDEDTSSYVYPTPYYFPSGSSYEDTLFTNLIVGHTYTIINYREDTTNYNNSYAYTEIYNANFTINYSDYSSLNTYYAETYTQILIPDTSSIYMFFENGQA